MAVKVLKPDSEAHWLELRTRVLTSTDVSALFGLSPYMTYAELWHRKKGLLKPDFEPTERMRWGNRLESAIAHGIAEDQGLKIKPLKDFYIDEENRLGSSFDFEVDPDGLLEIKNLDSLQFKEHWDISDEGDIEAPPHIEIQVQHQLLMSGRKNHMIGALVGGNQVKVMPREPNAEIIAAIWTESKKFWESIDRNEPPPPDFQKDAALYIQLENYARPGSVVDASGDARLQELAFQHREISQSIKRLEESKEALKAEMLWMIGDAEKVKCSGFSITAGMVGPAEVAYTREGYRQFRLNWPRSKK